MTAAGGDYCGGYVGVASDLHSLPMTRALGDVMAADERVMYVGEDGEHGEPPL